MFLCLMWSIKLELNWIEQLRVGNGSGEGFAWIIIEVGGLESKVK